MILPQLLLSGVASNLVTSHEPILCPTAGLVRKRNREPAEAEWLLEIGSLFAYSRPSIVFFLDYGNPRALSGPGPADWAHLVLPAAADGDRAGRRLRCPRTTLVTEGVNALEDHHAEPTRRGHRHPPMHFIWITDCSGSMSQDGKIQTLNMAIREAIPHMRKAADDNPHANLLVRAVSFAGSWPGGTSRTDPC